MNEVSIQIRDLIGSEFGVAEEDGRLVYDAILTALSSGEHAELSFEGMAFLTSPFIRALIGDLYEQFSEDHIRASLRPTHISADNARIFKFVVEDIKLRLHDPKAYNAARIHALELA